MKLLQYEWLLAAKGALLVLLGLFTCTFPAAGYAGLVVYFSLALLLTGLFLVTFALANRPVLEGWGWQLTEGLLDGLVGLVLLTHPAVTIVTMPVMVGLWAIFNAVLTLNGSWSLKRRGFVRWLWIALGGGFTFVFGFFTLFTPPVATEMLVLLTALTFACAGLTNLVTAYRLHQAKNHRHGPLTGHPLSYL